MKLIFPMNKKAILGSMLLMAGLIQPVLAQEMKPEMRISQRPKEEQGTSTQRNYATFTGLLLFTSVDTEFVESVDTGIGFSVSYGHLLGPNVALEGEFIFASGNIKASDASKAIGIGSGNYKILGLMVGPVLRFPLSQGSKIALFVSPGVGFASSQLDREVSGNFEGQSPTEDTSFAFQVKAGLEIETSKNWSILLQGRYLDASASHLITRETNTQSWSSEIGTKFRF